MENKEDGTRNCRFAARTVPDGLSYAKDIANRYGLDLEGILAGKMGRRAHKINAIYYFGLPVSFL